MLRLTVIVTVILIVLLMANSCATAEPRWQANVIARGAESTRIRSQPITARPYRPLHFYGNTVRRVRYRREVLPRPHDVRQTWQVLVDRERS